MNALTLSAIGHVSFREVPDPMIVHPTDAVVKVTVSAVCGSDLHVYHGRIAGVDFGVPIGHEYVGIIERVGDAVHRFKPGDRVTGSFFTACGQCWFCRRGYFSQCVQSALLGFGPRFGALPGSQAERVRIPHADYTLVTVPENIPDDAAIFVGDVLSTAYFAVERGGVHPGDTVVVVGAGPVGILAAEMAQIFGAARVIALDLVPDRLHWAEATGAMGILADQDVVKKVREATHGRGADVVIEAVGSEASLKLAIQVTRGFGTVSAAGVYTENALAVSMGRAFAKDLTVRAGMANVPAVFEPVIALLQNARIHPERLITHRLSLEDGALGYQLFDRKEALKVLLTVVP